MSCQRIDPKDFHSAAALDYTEKCVDDLVESPQFRRYAKHVEYRERLFLTWFSVPLSLLVLLWYHLCASADYLLSGSEFITVDMLSDHVSMIPFLPAVAIITVLFVLPSSIIAPFTGFFEEPTATDSFRLFVLLSVVNALVAGWGGEWMHHPPFLSTTPSLPWRDGSLSLLAHTLFGLTIRMLPIQGFIVGGYLVSVWQRSSWRRVWHVPFPLVSIPVVVGLGGAAWWYTAKLVVPYFVDGAGELTPAALYTTHVVTDPHGVLSLLGAIGSKVVSAAESDAMAWLASGSVLPPLLSSTTACVALYLSAMMMSITYFMVLLVAPIVSYFVGGLVMLLPTHPTTWGLLLLSAIGTLAYTVKTDEGSHWVPMAAPALLIVALLYNGFIA